jgi:hypothetical protein
VLEGEIQTLAYPMHVGSTWAIRGAPLFRATVETHEKFRGFSAWRVRIDSEFLQQDDYVHVWYSRCGELGHRFHFENEATSPEGIRIGRLVSDEIVDLIDLDISRGGCEENRIEEE